MTTRAPRHDEREADARAKPARCPPTDYSPTWFATFLFSIPRRQTALEVAFLARQLPRAAFPRVLDVCCGAGRHARPLARLGHEVTGLDRSPIALERARRHRRGVRYVQGDMRRLDSVGGAFDAVLSMWQSFGYHDARTNRAILNRMASRLRPGGRLVLDVYHRSFFERHQGVREFERNGEPIRETKRMRGSRLHVRLEYGLSGATDRFSWELFTPDELVARAGDVGLRALLACSGFDEALAPTPDAPRMQLVLERDRSDG